MHSTKIPGATTSYLNPGFTYTSASTGVPSRIKSRKHLQTFSKAQSLQNRPFSSTHCYHSEGAPPPPERDPTHPSLFYHSLPSLSSSTQGVFALSFLDKPLNPGHPRSRTIIGWVSEGDGGFQENPPFRDLLHESIASALEGSVGDLDPVIEAEALQRGEGWLHINDHRNVPPMGRIGDPDDIIGTVMVQGGEIIASTYQAMPSYRVCTADGPTRLPEGLARKLQESLEKEWEKERA
ncbi:hypothetical protein FRB94_014339 [Tulasnella sp. JGI-2019a]|nr:hypothetical protein FRB93_008633 [Tulasnella sp. JGI-2019a]KAG9007484.1 hypothetical protein FRB94_014339 [Tulasnella sp. JGI-2019a]